MLVEVIKSRVAKGITELTDMTRRAGEAIEGRNKRAYDPCW